jgi:transposase
MANEDADAEIARLTAIITAFERHRIGARSEKLNDDQLELALEELDAALSGVQAGLDAAGARTGTARPRKANRGSLRSQLQSRCAPSTSIPTKTSV